MDKATFNRRFRGKRRWFNATDFPKGSMGAKALNLVYAMGAPLNDDEVLDCLIEAAVAPGDDAHEVYRLCHRALGSPTSKEFHRPINNLDVPARHAAALNEAADFVEHSGKLTDREVLDLFLLETINRVPSKAIYKLCHRALGSPPAEEFHAQLLEHLNIAWNDGPATPEEDAEIARSIAH